MIIGSAIKIDGVVHWLPKPNRHHNVIRYLLEEKNFPPPILGEQGFYDSELGFLNRREAACRALTIGQIKKLQWPPDLYSEDLW